jgi:hypothetical protein
MPAWRHVVLLCSVLATSCQRTAGTTGEPSQFQFFIPPDAQNVRNVSRQGMSEVAYEIAMPYPAARFICELDNAIGHGGWRALREDFLNPGTPTSHVRGWNDFINGVKKPQTHEHVWSGSWLSDDSELLLYWLEYEYPEGAKPDFGTLRVKAIRWPANIVQALVGAERVSQLTSFAMRYVERGCTAPPWSRFVTDVARDPDPVFSPMDLSAVDGIEVDSDVGGLADRIADAIRARNPLLPVGTLQKRLSSGDGPSLMFQFACRCKQRGAPDGFYVTEVVVYKPSIAWRTWRDPARVLFYWSDRGDPAWKHVSKACFNERVHSPSCLSAFRAADISFVDALSSALGNRPAQPGDKARR